MKKFEMIVGLEVLDDESYAAYREAMKPILTEYGGGFRYDFIISETLKSNTPGPINRLFAIYFDSEDQMNQFFSNDEYIKVKSKFFEESVGHTTIISQYKIDL